MGRVTHVPEREAFGDVGLPANLRQPESGFLNVWTDDCPNLVGLRGGSIPLGRCHGQGERKARQVVEIIDGPVVAEFADSGIEGFDLLSRRECYNVYWTGRFVAGAYQKYKHKSKKWAHQKLRLDPAFPGSSPRVTILSGVARGVHVARFEPTGVPSTEEHYLAADPAHGARRDQFVPKSTDYAPRPLPVMRPHVRRPMFHVPTVRSRQSRCRRIARRHQAL